MAELILPSGWTQQPQCPLEVNLQHTLASKLVFLFNAAYPTDVFSNSQFTAASGGSYVPLYGTAAAVGWKSTATTDYLDFASPQYLRGAPTQWTVFSVLQSVSGATASIAVNINYNGSEVPLNLCLGGQPAYNGASCFTGGSWYKSGIVTDIRGDNKTHTVAGVFSAGVGLYYYVDGLLDSSGAAPASIGLNSNAVSIGSYKGDTTGNVGPIAMVAIFNTALAARDIVLLHRAPWQLFAPLRRAIYFNVPAAGAIFLGQAVL